LSLSISAPGGPDWLNFGWWTTNNLKFCVNWDHYIQVIFQRVSEDCSKRKVGNQEIP